MSLSHGGQAALRRPGALLALLLLLSCGGLAACTGHPVTGRVRIHVSAPVALADQAVQTTVTGLAAHQRVTITAQAHDAAGRLWQARATFTADASGVVDLATRAPVSGAYRGADSMGLLWSMQPVLGDGNEFFVPLAPQRRPGFQVRLTASTGGSTLASRVLVRRWFAAGETARTLTLASSHVSGVLYLPRPGTPRHPGVLVFGGAEGGMSQTFTAALLAAHGYPALTVAYFGYPGLPGRLADIPLEYFETAGRILAAAPGVDPAHVIVMGYSRGSEAALLLAENFPRLFHGAIVYSPSAVVNPAAGSVSQPAWTLAGLPLPQVTIPVRHISGPVLAVAGGDDGLWSSLSWANEISAELTAARNPYPHRALIYLFAGHAVGTYPYQPIGKVALLTLGGSRTGDVTGQRASWARVLTLLAGFGTIVTKGAS